MTLRDRLSAIDRFQKSRGFKIAATCLIVLLGIAGFIAYAVAVQADKNSAGRVEVTAPAAAPDAATADPTPETPDEQKAAAARAAQEKAERSALEATARSINAILERRQDPTSVGVGVAAAVGVALAVVWLGLGLTYLGLALLAGLIAGPLWLFPGSRGLVPLVVGVVLLTAAFAALMRSARVLFSLPGVSFAIARNVLAEAVRLRVSLIFIVLLIFTLAALPMLLDSDSPLRYRVQAFLQYATGGAFWLIAVLVLVFSVATVAFEQRDRVIWQTMTKPVTSLQYVLGKWLGVVALSGILLTVCGSAIFLFTEYLRSQPAVGEQAAYVSRSGGLTEDRLILETQVLSARVARSINPPALDDAQFEENVRLRIQQEKEANEFFRDDPETVAKIRKDLYESVLLQFRSIDPGTGKRYTFTGLDGAKAADAPITFRYKIESGSNRPDITYRVTFVFSGSQPIVREITLGQRHQFQISPAAVRDDGTVEVEVYNGDVFTGRLNERTMHLPAKEGLQLSYAAGGYRANFIRVMLVLWVKLAFLSMLAICAATCLSFPVACLVSFGTFIVAEGAGFISDAAANYKIADDKGVTIIWRKIAEQVSMIVSDLFKVYSDLRPTTKLVDGVLMSWGDVAVGTAVLALGTALLLVAAVVIFKRRELATYSGH